MKPELVARGPTTAWSLLRSSLMRGAVLVARMLIARMLLALLIHRRLPRAGVRQALSAGEKRVEPRRPGGLWPRPNAERSIIGEGPATGPCAAGESDAYLTCGPAQSHLA